MAGNQSPHSAFLFYAAGRPTMSYSKARLLFETYLQRAGLGDKGYTLHALRHTFATELLNAGMRIECLPNPCWGTVRWMSPGAMPAFRQDPGV